MRNVSRIDIVMENCEVLGLPAASVGAMSVRGIERTIGRIAVNAITEMVRCGEFSIELLPNANVTERYLDGWGARSDGDLPFKRLQAHNDICAIDVIYYDGTNEYIYVPWGGDDDYTNEYQRSEMTQDGRLRITIEETEVSA